ncbi:MAG: GNAT family N-acetyltransferase [Actinomycetota bacterium]|nr:GNAT family N-acetyltransferase [Actinomycetota bacterium]
MTETVEFIAMSADLEPACSLIAETLAAGERAYGRPHGGEAPSATAAEMAPPDGAFFVAYEHGLPVACGGLKRFDDETAEIKRMYVTPQARSRGFGRSLLSTLEAEARRLGYRYARLDAGPRSHHARALYESAGYAAIPAYNHNPLAAYWAEKRL